MGLTLITDEKNITVYRKDKVSQAGNNYSTYCLKISSKDRDDNWQSAFVNVRFKKGVSVNNKSKIKIKNAFPTIDSYNGNNTISWMVTEFDVVEEGEKPAENVNLDEVAADTFMNIPEGLEELPFN